ncbi:winged helix-turn-helix transcriptional regulator [Streptomyces acidiscabies]|uniref:winged helix-turn-helix transcriptional regulator n=1 Tax=Streptomyces acidiscabies TaxID=42234 RepID=UPI0002899C46|nr:winged helix-turn-helix transcriptional regulator [Streptomyces acidiscabies]MBP5942153.1 helix-turn-helix transcriptional regulator [Streptomyces sp. LBUM 1476]MBZ3913667.1 helix-turn-helix transcriptional regulator [Streptomyces acidiscabies]
MSDPDHPLPECPIARFLTVLDGTWATLIVRELLTGPKRFTELRRHGRLDRRGPPPHLNSVNEV